MDPIAYKREVDRLANETNSIVSAETDSVPSPSSKGLGIWKYKNYILISLGALAFLYLVKPKMVLKIEAKEDKTPCMVVDTGKFILAWIVLTVIASMVLFVYLKFRKT